MILVCELFCKGLSHAPVNSAILTLINSTFENEKIVFLADQSHIAEVSKQLNGSISSKIEWKPIKTERRSRFAYYSLLEEIVYLKDLIERYQLRKSRYSIFTSTDEIGLIALKALIGTKGAWPKVHIMLHSVLQRINGVRSKNPFSHILNMKTAFSFKCSSHPFRYLVLEESIRNEMTRTLPFLKGQVDVLDHPVPPCAINPENVQPSLPIKFGFPGLATKSKGFDLFIRAAKIVKQQYPRAAEFHSIGSLGRYQKTYDTRALDTQPCGQKLDQTAYIKRLTEMHYLCFPYTIDKYRLVSSGALLDAVAYEKPIVATKCGIITHMAETAGDIGYLFDDFESFVRILISIAKEHNSEQYDRFRTNLKHIKAKRTCENLVDEFRKITE